jgi:hypothetical protein
MGVKADEEDAPNTSADSSQVIDINIGFDFIFEMNESSKVSN